MEIRFNHMEITFPIGALTPEFRRDVEAFYGDVYGFEFTTGEMFGQNSQLMTLKSGDFLLLIEGDEPMSARGFDHLGFDLASRADVDDTLAKARQWQQKDDRVQLKGYPDGALHGRLYHAYYVKFLLPIWFDVQYSEVIAPQE